MEKLLRELLIDVETGESYCNTQEFIELLYNRKLLPNQTFVRDAKKKELSDKYDKIIKDLVVEKYGKEFYKEMADFQFDYFTSDMIETEKYHLLEGIKIGYALCNIVNEKKV